VEWKAYEGAFPWVPDFENLTAAAAGASARPTLRTLTREQNVGMLFTGYLDIPRAGYYTFYLTADTGALLRIHEATVIDADYGYLAGAERSGRIRLQAGLHPFRLYYARRNQGQPKLEFSWEGPGVTRALVPATAFRRRPAAH
jgi:hypothetical protein